MVSAASERSSTSAWAKGAAGERKVAKMLDSVASRDVVSLHDRRVPGRRSNIDHIAVAPSAVFVIDAKHYRGRVECCRQRTGRSWQQHLIVNGRDRTHLIDELDEQRRTVDAIVRSGGVSGISVVPVLCFVGGDWPLLRGPFQVRGALITPPRALRRRLAQPGAITPQLVAQLAESLSRALPIA